MGWFSSKVEVTFIDDASGEPLGVTKMAPGDLPESFDLDTTLSIGSDDWSVVDAVPKTRVEYAQTKSLTLRLRRIELMDPGDVLYSLPSICDAIPGLGDQPLSGSEFVVAEDDWRQFELVSGELAPVVDAEIEQIRRIHERAAAEVGWRDIHVRSKPEPPLTCDLGLAQLTEALNVAGGSIGVTYRGAQSRILDGYAFHASGVTVYGVAPHGRVQVIAVDQYSATKPEAEAIARLKALAQVTKLGLVYWCRCARASTSDPLFESLISGDAE